MGIPFLFYHIVKKNVDVVVNDIGCSIDRLYLDFNSIIHMCSAAVVHRGGGNGSWEEIFAKIIDHTINQIVLRCKPSELLYIAIDGVAPLAKIQQQRKRRYMTAYRNALINDFKERHGIKVSEWDSNIITPGTEFMKELDRFLVDYFSQAKQEELGFRVIVSGSSEPGEGEHKMIRYIKELKCGGGGVDVIYGLDADLIMLSLTCELDRKLYLMRESSTFEDIAEGTSYFKFLDIDGLRQHVGSELADDTNASVVRYMHDYVALCFLLGNDFLPGLSFLKIKSGGIELIKRVYKEIRNETGEHLIECVGASAEKRINEQFLTKLFEKLYSIEDDEMMRIHHEWIKQTPFINQKHTGVLDRFIASIENYPHVQKSLVSKRMNMGSPKWRDYYYHELFGINNTTNNRSIASKYIEGLNWTVDYYFNKKSSNTWTYWYNFAPTVMDLYMTRFVSSGDGDIEDDNIHKHNIEITPQLQLALVLPPSSLSTVLPKFNHDRCNILYLYPQRFVIDVYLKNQLWECIPRLPSLNNRSIDRINQMLQLSDAYY
jgi:5'-3' exonuclease